MKGIYCLVLFLKRGQYLRIGKRLRGFFPRGYYCYVGSAMNNLEERIERHKSKRKTKRWHIDYLTEKASIVGVLKVETERRGEECKLARKVMRSGGAIVVKGFGSSDCKCGTHLYYFNKNPLDMLR